MPVIRTYKTSGRKNGIPATRLSDIGRCGFCTGSLLLLGAGAFSKAGSGIGAHLRDSEEEKSVPGHPGDDLYWYRM